jgi:hypothetical protein
MLVAAVAMEIILRWLPNDFKFKRAQLEEKTQEIETIVLGGSHNFYGLNPAYFESNTYNLAYVTQAIWLDHALLEKYIDQMPNLQNVILMMAYISLSMKQDEAELAWRKYNYYRYYDISPPPNRDYQKYYLEIFNLPLQRNVKKVYHQLKGKDLVTCDSNGWCYHYTDEGSQDLRRTGIAEAKKHENNSMDFTANIEVLKEIISLCEERNIRVLLLTSPSWVDYRNNLNPEKYNKLVTTCTHFSEQNDHVDYYTFFDDSRFTAKHFHDADHLNHSGTAIYSRIINNIIESNNLSKK